MNEIANICELLDVDVKVVGQGIGHDHRIGTQFMNPGIGYGGSCFPKDVRALEMIAGGRRYEATLLRAVERVNQRQVDATYRKVVAMLGGEATGKLVGVLGLSFKPNTDDIREAPALLVIDRLLAAGARVRAHDPIAMDAVRAAYGDRIEYCSQLYEASNDVDVLLLATEWNEYKNIDFVMIRKLMRGSVVIDGRNIFDPELVLEAGLDYIGVGRPRRSPTRSSVPAS
jgi:UDPglucose 6-dehydrogenase